MNFLDLFAGAGGLSEGFLRSGFKPIAHIEQDKYACKTLETRSIYYYLRNNNRYDLYLKYQASYNTKENEQIREELYSAVPKCELEPVINISISEKSLPSIFDIIDKRLESMGEEKIDLIIGGPPCQAYSLVGRARDEFSMEGDPRNFLYKMYIRFLSKYQPKAFVFENVPGILTAFKGELFKNLKAYMKRVGYNIEAKKIDAKDFGVLQSRKRIIIIGWRKDLIFQYPEVIENDMKYKVQDLFNDLPAINAGEVYCDKIYASPLNETLREMKIRDKWDIVTHHIARSHIQRDLDIYKIVVDKWNKDKERMKYTDFPEKLRTHKNLTSFLDRFKVVAGNQNYSHTIVAHIAKDGHHYIHPDIEQNRSLTVREAARIQSFPDNYYFEGPRTANFTQIGNAVPPLMSEYIANWFRSKLIEL